MKIAIVFCVIAGVSVLTTNPVGAADVASFLGAQSCAECHKVEYRDWSGSHHDLAMQEATKATVLGDFGDAEFTAYGVTSRFFNKKGDFYVNTEGPDGVLQDYKIDYTFGVYPLQQYLVAFPGGRYQVLGIAWDTRAGAKGGQRWFHLYPDEQIAHGDVLHWTGINQNWNYMCADCHSTNLRRNFDLENNRYETMWSAIDVSCEACHGPGSKHVAWARTGNSADAPHLRSKGLVVQFGERKDIRWTLEKGAVTAKPSARPAKFRTEVETCGRCHSRRAPLGNSVESARPILDSYRVALLGEDLYHADGQIKEEVYVYGSFIQSRMYRAGVTCSDCHDPHSLTLKAKGNDLCTRCHVPETFDTPAHHFHSDGAPGSRCVDCHAPETTYMVVDPRRDHSFRVPRPDLALKLGMPDACSSCHDDKSATWAADRVAERYGPDREQSPHFAEAIAAGREGEPAAQQQLVQIALDNSEAAIVRATALDTLGRNLSPDAFPAIQQSLRAEDPLIRLAALGTLEPLAPAERFRATFPLLEDPVRAVRLETARLLAPVPLEALQPEQRRILAAAFKEYEEAHKGIADRPESLTALANFYGGRGALQQAEVSYRQAITQHPWFVPAYVNLADLYRSQRQDEKGEDILRVALTERPEQGGVHHALGLLLIRGQRYVEATRHLGEAAKLEPGNSRYMYVYALAQQKIGDTKCALSTLRSAHNRHPNDGDILFALATMSRDSGDLDSAVRYAEALIALSPTHSGAMQLLEALR